MDFSAKDAAADEMSPTEIVLRVTRSIKNLGDQLPDGILDCSLGKESAGGRQTIRVDSRNNDALTPFLEQLKHELNANGLELGEHIRIGFHDDEQADAWYLNQI